MPNMPNITPVEVAVVSSAAFLLCILPNVLIWADSRRHRRRLAADAQASLMERHAVALVDVASGAPPPPPAVAEVEVVETIAAVVATPLEPAPEPPVVEAPAAVAVTIPPEPSPREEVPLVATSTAAIENVAASERSAVPPPNESARYTVRLDELRRVKLPNWPPAEVRDNPDKKRVWDEATRVAEQPLITSMALKSEQPAESACLAAADNEGSMLRLHFLLFADMWPVAANQACAEAIFELDSASGQVRGGIRSL